ncbi:MAG TPA: LamG-like jellyroll fold domain-containing protein, partial [Anaerolineales bacterium]
DYGGNRHGFLAFSETPLDKTLVPPEQTRLDQVNAALQALPLPDRTLVALARLEMAENPQLVAGIIQTQNSAQLSQAELAAAQNIQQLQAIFNQNLSDLEPWLEQQLNLNVSQARASGTATQPAAGTTKTGAAQPATGTAKTGATQPGAQSNPAQDQTLVGYWTFNDGPGNTQIGDSSKSKITGNLMGSAALITTAPAPVSKPNPFSLSLDGQGWVEMKAAPAEIKGNTSWTVSFWMKYRNPAQSTFSWILDIGDNKGPYAGLHWLINKTGRAEIGFTKGLENSVDIRAYLDQWVQVTTVYDAQAKTLVSYLNGIEASRGTLPGQPSLNPAAGMRIGQAGNQADENYNGLLDNLLIYSRALTAAEVTKLAAGQRPETTDDQVALKYLLALRATQNLLKAGTDLAAVQKADADVAAAQQSVATAQASADEINKTASDAQKQDQQVSDLEAQAAQARAASNAAATPQDRSAAEARLAAVNAQLAQARLVSYQNLLDGEVALEQRETTLADLSTRLETATDRSVEAAMQAYQKNNVERIIGPFLDLLLNPKSPTPLKSPQEAIYPAALLAAQQALKTPADAQVDVARAALNDAIERQNRLQNLSGAADVRQRILNQINDYLNSLQKEVTVAQQNLQDAQAQQKKDQPDSTIKPLLADALARSLAQRVTDVVVARLGPSSGNLLVNNPVLTESIKTSLRGELANRLEQVRFGVRLNMYFTSYYTAARLQGELAAGGDNAPIRALKSATLLRLRDVNLNLLRVMNARNELLQPAVGFTDIIQQVADESGRAASLDELIKALQTALKNSESPLKQMVAYQQAIAQSPGGALTPNLGLPGFGGATATPAAPAATPTPAAPTATPAPAATPASAPTPTPLLQSLGGTGTASGQAGGVITSTGALTSSLLAPGVLQPTNIWAGLIVTDDGHVALVAKPQGAPDWSTFKDEKPLAVGQWIHYAGVIVYDASSGAIESLSIIRNGSHAIGAQPGQNAVDVRVDSTNCLGFFIGGLCGSQGSFNFAGLIDDVRVWNRALTSIEINSWRNLPGERLNEVAYWSFDDASNFSGAGNACPASTACDQSKTGNYPLRVLGPLWVPAAAQQVQFTSTRQ